MKISLIEQAPNATEKARLKNLLESAGKKSQNAKKSKQLGKMDAAIKQKLKEFRDNDGNKTVDINEQIRQIRIARGNNDTASAQKGQAEVNALLDAFNGIVNDLFDATLIQYDSDEVKQMDEEVSQKVIQVYREGVNLLKQGMDNMGTGEYIESKGRTIQREYKEKMEKRERVKAEKKRRREEKKKAEEQDRLDWLKKRLGDCVERPMCFFGKMKVYCEALL